MKKKNLILILLIFAVLIALFMTAWNIVNQETSGSVTPAPTNTPTSGVTVTEAPTVTNTPTPTVAPTTEPTVTNTPVPTVTSEPTVMPTVTPTQAATPTPTVTSTPAATPTPTVTSTPTPVPHVHEWVKMETPATCSTEGKTWEECECGEIQNETVLPKKEHESYTYTVISEPTVNKEGKYETTCNACGEVIGSGSIPKLTPTPKPTNTPTPTPTPTPVVEEGVKRVLHFQMGDKVWYDVYEDGTLVVTGKGATWDYSEEKYNTIVKEAEKAGDIWIVEQYDNGKAEYFKYIDRVSTIIIEEGITRIGDLALWSRTRVKKVVIPDTLKEVGSRAFMSLGFMNNNVEWVNLDLTKLVCANNSFEDAVGLENYEGSAEVMVTPTPTPRPTATPTPTPTPVPNPNKPRLVLSEKMGNNVTFEFWDNGYMYIKGTGKTYDMGWGFQWKRAEGPNAEYAPYPGYFSEEFLSSIKHLVVEEGITYLGNYTLFHLNDFDTITLPSTLTSISSSMSGGGTKVLTGYCNGKKCTIRKENGGYLDFTNIFKAADKERMELLNLIVEWK